MKTQIILAAIILSLTAPAQISVTRIKRLLETSKPQEIQLDLRRGETVAFDLQFLSYGTVMDISGATCTLHATTNGMPAGTSFQISGTSGSNGTASVRISVDDWLPYQLTSGTWTLECALPTASRIMRASGSLKVSGLYYPSSSSPIPVSWATNIWAAISATATAQNGYLPLTGGQMAYGDSTITFPGQYLDTAIGPYGFNLVTYTAQAISLLFPDDIAGEFYLATREWASDRIASATNGLVDASITNGLVGASITNGLVGASITNGLVGVTITNGILSAAQTYATSADTTAKGVSAVTATNAIAAASPGTAMIRLTSDRLVSATAPTNLWLGVLSSTAVGTQAVASVAIGTNLSYAVAIDCTNTPLTEVGGQMINYTLWLCESETGDQTARVEFWRHDIVADTWAAWGALGPTFTVPAAATPSLVTGAVFVPAISTNAYTLGMRLRRVAGTSAASCLLKIGTGAGYDSRLSISLPTYMHDTDASAHSNMARSSLLWTAAGTNATYRMYWDITNATFAVEEIIP